MPSFPFAKRTNWSLENNPLSVALEHMQAKGIPYIDLTESNPTHCGLSYPKTWLEALSDKQVLNYEPLPKGMLKTRGAIADYYAQRNYKTDSKNFVLTSSTSEGYSFLLKLLANPGDHVLIPKPSYPLFQFLLELHDVHFDYYPLVYDGSWKIDKEAFKALIKPKTKAVIVVNPNNPTCSYLSVEDRAFLNEQCVKNKTAIISDEVFLDYSLNPAAKPRSLIENAAALTFVLSGVSKILGLPQMKLSWIAVNGPQGIVQETLERLEIISDTYLSVNTPVQNALVKWLPESDYIQKQILERVKGNLETLKKSDFNVLAVEGGWYAVIDEPFLSSEEDFILGLLEKEHVLIHPGFFFDFNREGYLILSLLPKADIFKEALKRISRKMQIL